MVSMHRVPRLMVSLGVVLSIHGCSNIFGLDEGKPRLGNCPEHIVFVSPDGDDASIGCSKSSPKRTIASAMARAKGLGLSGFTIQVCEGTFLEGPIVLDYPVSLRGGYVCGSWQRREDYGYDAKFATSLTILGSRDAAEGHTLIIAGPAIQRDTVVDGLTIRGPENAQVSYALLVRENASPTLSNNRIVGGSTAASIANASSYPFASGGVGVETGASPDIVKNAVDGGTGRNDSSNGSVGIFVGPTARPHIHGNTVDGGTGRTHTTPASASIGIFVFDDVTLNSDMAIEDNVISGGRGFNDGTASSVTYGSMGLFIQGERSHIAARRNVIHGGTPTCEKCAVGAVVSRDAYLELEANRIHGGEGGAYAKGVHLSNPRRLSLRNNVIHSGRASEVRDDTITAGVEIHGLNDSASIQGNTIIVDRSGKWSEALYLSQVTHGPSVDNNLFIGPTEGEPNTDWAFALLVCPPTAGLGPASFRNNAFVNVNALLVADNADRNACASASGTPRTVKNLTELETELPKYGTTLVGSNRRIAASCNDGETNCIRVPECAAKGDPLPCLQRLFSAWSAPSASKEVVDGTLHLRSDAPCEILAGGVDLSSGLTSDLGTDLFGRPRTHPLSIGAEEVDAHCAMSLLHRTTARAATNALAEVE